MNLEDMTKEEIIAYIRAEEAKKEKDALENRLRDLESRLRDHENRLRSLEHRVNSLEFGGLI